MLIWTFSPLNALTLPVTPHIRIIRNQIDYLTMPKTSDSELKTKQRRGYDEK